MLHIGHKRRSEWGPTHISRSVLVRFTSLFISFLPKALPVAAAGGRCRVWRSVVEHQRFTTLPSAAPQHGRLRCQHCFGWTSCFRFHPPANTYQTDVSLAFQDKGLFGPTMTLHVCFFLHCPVKRHAVKWVIKRKTHRALTSEQELTTRDFIAFVSPHVRQGNITHTPWQSPRLYHLLRLIASRDPIHVALVSSLYTNSCIWVMRDTVSWHTVYMTWLSRMTCICLPHLTQCVTT